MPINKNAIFFKYVTKRCRRATGNITSSGIEAGEKNFNESKAGEAKLEAFTKLTKILLDSKRYEDLDRATKDIEYQKKLMKDYNITD